MSLNKNEVNEIVNSFSNQLNRNNQEPERTATIPLKEYDNYKLIQEEFEKMCDKFNEVEKISRNALNSINFKEFNFNSTMEKEMYKIYCIMVGG